MTATIAFGTLALVAAIGPVEERSFDGKNLERLVIKSGRGQIELSARDTNTLTVRATKKTFDDGCRLEMAREGDEVVLENRQPREGGWDWESGKERPKCEVDFVVVVPSRLAVQVKLGKGDVTAGGAFGDSTFKIGKGDVRTTGSIQDLRVALGKGNMNLDGLVGRGRLSLGKGNVEVTYDRIPKDGELTIKAGRGDAAVYLPASARVRARLVAARGRLKNEFPNDPDATFRVTMKAGRGDLAIRKR